MIGLDHYVDDVKASLSLELEGLPLIAIVPVEGTIVPGDSEEGWRVVTPSPATSTWCWKRKILRRCCVWSARWQRLRVRSYPAQTRRGQSSRDTRGGLDGKCCRLRRLLDCGRSG